MPRGAKRLRSVMDEFKWPENWNIEVRTGVLDDELVVRASQTVVCEQRILPHDDEVAVREGIRDLISKLNERGWT